MFAIVQQFLRACSDNGGKRNFYGMLFFFSFDLCTTRYQSTTGATEKLSGLFTENFHFIGESRVLRRQLLFFFLLIATFFFLYTAFFPLYPCLGPTRNPGECETNFFFLSKKLNAGILSRNSIKRNNPGRKKKRKYCYKLRKTFSLNVYIHEV